MELSLRVRSLTWEAERVLTVRLEGLDGAPVPEWEAGAHVDLALPTGLVRQYSLCGSPQDRTGLEVAVLHEDAGRGGSRWIHETLRPGMVVQARGPRNHFPLVDAPGYLFIAGGIGITPILAMIETAQLQGRRWRLLYAGRSRRRMAFLDRLAEHEDRITLASSDEGERLDLQTWLEYVRSRLAGAHVYCCGPQPLLDDVQVRAAQVGLPVHLERFTAPTTRPDGALAAAFQVELARSGTSLAIGADESILDRLLAAGHDIANDCHDGICGSCVTTVLDGDVDHRDYILTEREKREGREMMVCVSRCRGDRLVLDL